jgi:hypothetical protein
VPVIRLAAKGNTELTATAVRETVAPDFKVITGFPDVRTRIPSQAGNGVLKTIAWE